MKAYLSLAVAQREGYYNMYSSLLNAHDEAEAEYLALHHARDVWPQKDGWINHLASVTELDKSTLRKLIDD